MKTYEIGNLFFLKFSVILTAIIRPTDILLFSKNLISFNLVFVLIFFLFPLPRIFEKLLGNLYF